MSKQVYILTGLGADHRVFRKMDFSGYEVSFIHWIQPEKGESIEAYAKRLSHQITSPKPVLIGLSFGGMMAIEIAKQIDTEKVILIASAKSKNEIPFYFRFAGQIRMHKVLKPGFLVRSKLATNWFFGIKDATDKALLKDILKDTDPVFLKWAIEKVLNWKNNTITGSVVHIHGSRDRILPHRYVKSDIVISQGGHLLTLNDPEELIRLIKENI